MFKHSTKSLFAVLFTLALFTNTTAQDSCSLRVSLLTCSPGEELYSTFGHSALRVTNTVTGQDIVYNYGTFDFAEPGFYTKFVRGKLLYYLSTETFETFASEYRFQNRGIIEQVLNLNCSEKEKIKAFLNKNLLPENRAYKYDFLFDNCTTRLRDIVEKVADSTVQYPKIADEGARFRDLIHIYLYNYNHLWSKFGIDLLLGNKTDGVMTNREAMFLPDYLMMSFDASKIGNKKLVSEKTILFEPAIKIDKPGITDYPVFYTSIIFLVVLVLTLLKNKNVKSFLRAFDSSILFLTGLLGILIIFMWFATDHIMCSDNFNLLWAWPTHVVAAFIVDSKRKWIRNYLTAIIIIYALVLLSWFIIPQQLNVTIIPLILVIMVRMISRLKNNAESKNKPNSFYAK